MNLITSGAEAALGIANPAAGAAMVAEKAVWPLVKKHLPAAIGGIAMLLLVIALMLTRHTLANVRHDSALDKAQLQLVLSTTRDAAHVPGLKLQSVPAQIAALGRGVDNLKGELDTANASVKAAAALDAQHQAQAAARMKQLQAGDAARQSVIDRLQAIAATPQPGPPCASDSLKEIWP